MQLMGVFVMKLFSSSLKRGLGASMALAALTISFTSPVNADVTLRWSNYLPPTHPLLNKALKPWFKEVAEATDSRVKINLVAAPMGPPGRQYDLVIDGIAGGTFGLHGFTPGRFKIMQVAELPFIGDSGEAISVALWRTYKKYIEKAGAHKRAVLVGLSTTSRSNIWGASKPITKMSDFKGLKLMSAGGYSSRVSTALGGVVVAVPPPKWYETVSRGIAEATLLPTGAPNSFKLNRFLKHQTLVSGGMANNSFFVVLNKDQWDKVSAADKKALEPLMGEHLSRRLGKIWDFIDVFGRKSFEKQGVKTVTASPEFVADLKSKLGTLESDWVKFANSKGVDGKAAVDFLRTEVAKEQAK